MADMVEVVIKIPKEKYDSICSMCEAFPAEMKERGLEYIKNGTVLSKGHGDLVDRDELLVHEKYGIEAVYVDDINDAPTIIEADTQSNIGGAVIERTVTAREITEELKRLYDLKEEDERRDAIMFLKGVRETLKDAD